MRALTCPRCGAPLTPDAHAVRVTCGHCQAAIDVTSEGAARLAVALESAGVKVASRPMTRDEIDAEVERRQAEEHARVTRERLLGLVLVLVAFAALGVFALLYG